MNKPAYKIFGVAFITSGFNFFVLLIFCTILGRDRLGILFFLFIYLLIIFIIAGIIILIIPYFQNSSEQVIKEVSYLNNGAIALKLDDLKNFIYEDCYFDTDSRRYIKLNQLIFN
ncbi:MAG: hypothetical protein EAX96_13785 [Candidatus Lokiarchaeota archaeon]|nr:hypothetical protein [Candidatus Lokiarchaeota archaeon]